MSTATPFLSVRGLYRRFEGVRAVNGVSFDLPTGTVVGLIGANGAGKTTTMRMLATLDLPDAGTIKLNGTDIVEYPNEVRRHIGWMPDHFAPYPDTTVADYLDFFARAPGLRGAALARRLALEAPPRGAALDSATLNGSSALLRAYGAAASPVTGRWSAYGGATDLAPIATLGSVRWADSTIVYTGVAESTAKPAVKGGAL